LLVFGMLGVAFAADVVEDVVLPDDDVVDVGLDDSIDGEFIDDEFIDDDFVDDDFIDDDFIDDDFIDDEWLGFFETLVYAIDLGIYRQHWANIDWDTITDEELSVLPPYLYSVNGVTVTFFLNGVPVPADFFGVGTFYTWHTLAPTEIGNWEAELTLPAGYRLETVANGAGLWGEQSLRISLGDGTFDQLHTWFITSTSPGTTTQTPPVTTPPVTGPKTGVV